MKMFLVLIAIIGIQPAIAQIDREELVSAVKEAIEESNNNKNKRYVNAFSESQQYEEARKKSLEVQDNLVKEAEKKYDENMKSGITNISHNAEPWWAYVEIDKSCFDNTYNSESSDIESTEKTSYPIKTWQIVAGIIACILLFCEGVKYVVRRIKKSAEI